MNRDEILQKAREIVTGDRDDQYGSPEDCFKRIAKLWEAYLGVPMEPNTVAEMMILFKLARIQNNPAKEDHWVDIAGYAACGGETVSE